MPLEAYKDLVATAANVTTIAQFFAPIFLCKTIVQNGTSKGTDIMPFIGGMVLSVLFLQYGLIINEPAMLPVNIFGFGLNLGYTICYYLYTPDDAKTQFFGTVAKATALVAVLLGYTQWEDETLVAHRYGLITTVLMLLVIGAPLFSLGEIIRTKNTESLPLPMILSGTVVTSLWLLYGIIIGNIFMQVQNVVGLALCVTQLSLIIIYSGSPAHKAEDKKTK